jgi:hypothetical protein
LGFSSFQRPEEIKPLMLILRAQHDGRSPGIKKTRSFIERYDRQHVADWSDGFRSVVADAADAVAVMRWTQLGDEEPAKALFHKIKFPCEKYLDESFGPPDQL